MERWGKLQLRIEAVQARKEARLKEMARRKAVLPTQAVTTAAALEDKENGRENVSSVPSSAGASSPLISRESPGSSPPNSQTKPDCAHLKENE